MLIPKFDLYKSEWLELVFEKRNKLYGAYELRQHYSQTMVKAMALTVFGFVSIAITLSFLSRAHQVPVEIIKTTVVDLKNKKVVLPPPPKADKPLQQKPAAPLTAKPSLPSVALPTHITSEPVVTDPPTLTQIAASTISSEPSKGTGTAVNADPSPAPATGNRVGSSEPNTTVFEFAEVSPEPSGGMAGWSKFLQRNLRYPDTEAQGRVFVSFVVELDGSLSNIKIVKGVSPELDAEALRVLRMAPKWKPGMQNHQPVRVQFNIPINFQLN